MPRRMAPLVAPSTVPESSTDVVEGHTGRLVKAWRRLVRKVQVSQASIGTGDQKASTSLLSEGKVSSQGPLVGVNGREQQREFLN